MSDQTIGVPSGESAITLFLKRLWRGIERMVDSILLLRESVVGMVGAGLVTFWVIMALMPGWLAPCGAWHAPQSSATGACSHR